MAICGEVGPSDRPDATCARSRPPRLPRSSPSAANAVRVTSTTSVGSATRVAAICETAVRAIVSFRPLRQFVRQDPEYALRLLVSKIGPVQRRSIDQVRDLLQAEAARGLVLPLGVDTLAYLIVRLCESFIYADVISDQQVDVADAGLAVQLLLSGRVEQP